MAGQSGDSGQSLRSMTKPPWRCSLIEALTMTCAEIDERRARYEAMSEEEYQNMAVGQGLVAVEYCVPAQNVHARELTPATRIAELEATIDQMRREIMMVRSLLSRVEETTTEDPVRADVERTIDHLQRHLVKDKQFGDLKKAVEQAGRTNGKSDAAINDIRGRALR